MKIIQVDNFDRDHISDVLVAENITSQPYGELMVEVLNVRYSGEGSQLFFKLVPDSHKLYIADHGE